jgi:hypothetical protein
MVKFYILIGLVFLFSSCGNTQKQENTEANKPHFYSITIEEKICLLDAPYGNKILNIDATNHFGENTYYQIGPLDKVKIVEEKDGWAKVQHSLFKQNTGWIEKYKLFDAGTEPNNLDTDIYMDNPAETLSAGSVGYIRRDCAAACSKEYFDLMCKYLAANNQDAFQNMAFNGEIIYLTHGDKVIVLENGFGWTKIEYNQKVLYLIQGYLSSKSSGKYTNAETGEKQGRYAGSQEQKEDLKSIDEYGKQHPEFW